MQNAKDYEYTLLNVVKKNGERDLKFIGIGHVKERVAVGHLAAFKEGANDTVEFDNFIMLINHVSTDGENKTIGHYHGLWRLLDDEREKADAKFPLLKSVCAVHSTANAYKEFCKSVPEIDHLVKKLYAISSFFHASAQRRLHWKIFRKRKISHSAACQNTLKSDGQNLCLHFSMQFCAHGNW